MAKGAENGFMVRHMFRGDKGQAIELAKTEELYGPFEVVQDNVGRVNWHGVVLESLRTRQQNLIGIILRKILEILYQIFVQPPNIPILALIQPSSKHRQDISSGFIGECRHHQALVFGLERPRGSSVRDGFIVKRVSRF